MSMIRSLSVLLAALALSGCAAVTQLSSEVSSYGAWPAQRQASTYAFERLPSQQQQPEQQGLLEEAARPALAAAGFRPASDTAAADYLVQLGARISADERRIYSDPFGPWGLHGFYRRSRFGYGLGFGPYGPGAFATPQYDREVILLIRDRRSGLTVYETRASNHGNSSAINGLLPAMFAAAMKDFPSAGMNPRRVVTPLTQ